MFSSAIVTGTLLAISLFLQPTPVGAGLTYFNGPTCNGGNGPNFACDGNCQSFNGQSFFVDPGSGLHCVTLYPDAGCPAGLEEFHFPSRDAQCTSVNLGIDAKSFRCSVNNRCITS